MNKSRRMVICLPNQANISGCMTLDFAKALADEKCIDKCLTISIIVIDDLNDAFSCLERKEGEWKEKEIQRLTFSKFLD